MTAHPRSRGENVIPQCGGGALGGSSPLTRGKRGVRQATGETVRLIPAHAGKTAWRATAANPASAHPRSRGENTRDGESVREVAGSSPLTRGKLSNGLRSPSRPRLIPAHAGKTHTHDVMQTTHTAHSRSRGENEYGFAVADKDSGSSPLTRGKLGVVGVRGPVVGLIPAHAGKTSRQADKARVHEAHPRSRGENKGTSEHTTGPGGSSPLTRGKRLGAKDMYDLSRLIPAHAGKTL